MNLVQRLIGNIFFRNGILETEASPPQDLRDRDVPKIDFAAYGRKPIEEEDRSKYSQAQLGFYDSYWAAFGRAPPHLLVEMIQGAKTFRKSNPFVSGETAYRVDGRWLVHTDKLRWAGGEFIGLPPTLWPYQRRISEDYALGVMLEAKAQGWAAVKLHGTKKADKDKLWLAAKQVGLAVRDDYHPSAATLEKWEKMAPDVTRQKVADLIDGIAFEARSVTSILERNKYDRFLAGMKELKDALSVEAQGKLKEPYNSKRFQQINDFLDQKNFANAFHFGISPEASERIMHSMSGGRSAATPTGNEYVGREEKQALRQMLGGQPELEDRFDRNVMPYPMTLMQYEQAQDAFSAGEFENGMTLIETGIQTAGPAPRSSSPASSPSRPRPGPGGPS